MFDHISVDFDGTLFVDGKVDKELVDKINEKYNGKVFIFTSRSWGDYYLIKGLLTSAGLEFEGLVCGKLMVGEYLDDRNRKIDEFKENSKKYGGSLTLETPTEQNCDECYEQENCEHGRIHSKAYDCEKFGEVKTNSKISTDSLTEITNDTINNESLIDLLKGIGKNSPYKLELIIEVFANFMHNASMKVINDYREVIKLYAPFGIHHCKTTCENCPIVENYLACPWPERKSNK